MKSLVRINPRHLVPSHCVRCISITPRAFSAESASRIIGDGVGAFVLFYCSLQWLHYRRIREMAEKAEQDCKQRKQNINKLQPKEQSKQTGKSQLSDDVE